MSTQRAPMSKNPKSSHAAIRISRLAIITVGLFSAYACDVPDDHEDPFAEDAEVSFEDEEKSPEDTERLAEVDDELSPEDADLLAEPSSPPTESCELALDAFPGDDQAYLSCTLDRPVDSSGFTADDLTSGISPGDESDYAERACNTYYGTCSGISGCSHASGEGWGYTACGSFLYAWMTICDGVPSGWGTGACLW